MKLKNLSILTLGLLSFIGVIWLGRAPAMSLSSFHTAPQTPSAEIIASRSLSQEHPIAELNKNALEQQAEQLYKTGQYSQAIALLKQLNADYTAQGDQLGQARILRNLCLVYQQTGEWDAATEAITDSLHRLQGLSESGEQTKLLAETLEVQGKLQLSRGDPEQALETWQNAADIYNQIGDISGATRSQINQTQAQRRLGLYREALRTLEQVNASFQQQPDTRLKAQGLQSLGNALQAIGNLEQADNALRQSLSIAQKIPAPESVASTLLSLGNTARLQQQFQAALDFYQRAAAESPSPDLQIQAQVNQLSLFVDQKQESKALELVPQIRANLTQLPLSRTAVNARINLAQSLIKMAQQREGDVFAASHGEIAQLLATAVQQAQRLNDKRTLAYALGNLGGLYEQNKQWNYAQELTEKALLLAQGINASDIAYRWQWQLGRLLIATGNREGAIAAYSQAVNTLQSLRSDLVAVSSDVQFSFRESVEPVYRELVGLLLQPGATPEQANLIKAREVIESLQLAELDNFFRDACLNAKPTQIDQLDQTAAVFYPIILSDRLEVIVTLPGKPLRQYTTFLPKEQIEQTIQSLLNAATIRRLRLSSKNILNPAQKLYNWLIRPVEAELAASGVKTLVFVPDGALRNLPLSALHDGERYIIEKYSVAIAPSLQLVDPQPLTQETLKILAFGLSEARLGFQPLPNVQLELERITAEMESQILLNDSFTKVNFQQAIKTFSFPIVHLATHGQFSSSADDTFILSWDSHISVKDFDDLLRTQQGTRTEPIELLVLSACTTAKGDERAALGLAGVAVRAGTRSTLASLWVVSDEATALLMTTFYEELAKNQATKAESLRLAQLRILQDQEFAHPYYWAPFVIVGNWL
ncbi:MAG: CHAT domain-containing protein [Coleofasciculus sp. G3-WIS-01]|uniref:CHAT domain-containing protein n=1 Tax=Coleofasciculus sp. G3-WIS-01 TaxID=3069528 RepID=UPI0032F16E6B